MRLAHEREIIGLVVAGIVVEVRDGHAGRDLQTAHHAAPYRIRGKGYASRLALLSRWQCKRRPNGHFLACAFSLLLRLRRDVSSLPLRSRPFFGNILQRLGLRIQRRMHQTMKSTL